MASQRLTNLLKENIQKNIYLQVEKTMEDSIPGKELQEMKDTLVAFLVDHKKKVVQRTEMAVLKKFGKTCSIAKIYLTSCLNRETQEQCVQTTFYSTGMPLSFNPALELPDTYQLRPENYIRAIRDNAEMHSLTLDALKIHKHIACEIKETTAAFMEIVNNYTTVAKLLADNPALEKYIPTKNVPGKKPPISKKAQSIIKNYLAA